MTVRNFPIGDFSTGRLTITRLETVPFDGFSGSLLEDLSALLSPAVLDHLPEPLRLKTEPGAVRAWMAARLGESGVWLVRQAGKVDVIGMMLLAHSDQPDEDPVTRADADRNSNPSLRLGYLLAESVWGRGFATELVEGLLKALVTNRWRGDVLAGVDGDNPASARVLIKAGFQSMPMDPGQAALFIRHLR